MILIYKSYLLAGCQTALGSLPVFIQLFVTESDGSRHVRKHCMSAYFLSAYFYLNALNITQYMY